MRCVQWIMPLVMVLAGCATVSAPLSTTPALVGTEVQIRTVVRRVCAEPTDADRRRQILAELDGLDAAGMLDRVDVLATEYERLDSAARACRGM